MGEGRTEASDPQAGEMPAQPTLPLRSTQPDQDVALPVEAVEPQPTSQRPAIGRQPSRRRKSSRRLRRVARVVAGIVAVAFIGSLLATAIGQIGYDSHPSLVGQVVLVDDAVAPPGQDVGGTEPETASEPRAGEPTALMGTNYGLDVAVPVQGFTWDEKAEFTWNVTVGKLYEMTDEVVAQDDDITSPPAGFSYVGMDVEMVLASASAQPIAAYELGSWEITGGASGLTFEGRRVQDCAGFGGGALRGEVFAGGSIAGTACFPLPVEDVGHPDTMAVLATDAGGIVFSADGDTSGEAAPVVPGPGIDDLGPAIPFGVPTTVKAALSSLSGDHTWEITVGPWQEIEANTELVDIAWVIYEIEFKVVRSNAALSPVLALDWEVIGGETLRIYNRYSIGASGCGDLNSFDELREGDTLVETICIPVPMVDLDHPDTRLGLSYWGERISFADQ